MSTDAQVALVTGANKGIGREIVRQLAGRGARVFLTARNVPAGEKAARDLGAGVEFLPLDVTDAGSTDAAVIAFAEKSNRLDVLVNNAGVVVEDDDDVFTVSSDTLLKSFRTNTLGPLRVTQAFLPLLRKSDAPRVINISSGAGQLSGELQHWAPAYSISKTALNSVTQQLAAALPDFAVNSVCPGWVRTEMGGSAAPRSVEEGADTAVWLALDSPHSLTGKFLRDRKVIEW